KTTMPFYKNNEFDYGKVLKFIGAKTNHYSLLVFMFFVIVIITAISNGANITDGIDGLATGTSAIIGVTLAILAYVSGNEFIADYLNIMYIPNSGELVIFAGAFVGACAGFYGRYRQPGNWRYHSGFCHHDTQGINGATVMRDIPGRKSIGDYPGRM